MGVALGASGLSDSVSVFGSPVSRSRQVGIHLELISLEENLENLPRHVSDGLRDDNQKSRARAQTENPQNHAASHQPKSMKFDLKTISEKTSIHYFT